MSHFHYMPLTLASLQSWSTYQLHSSAWFQHFFFNRIVCLWNTLSFIDLSFLTIKNISTHSFTLTSSLILTHFPHSYPIIFLCCKHSNLPVKLILSFFFAESSCISLSILHLSWMPVELTDCSKLKPVYCTKYMFYCYLAEQQQTNKYTTHFSHNDNITQTYHSLRILVVHRLWKHPLHPKDHHKLCPKQTGRCKSPLVLRKGPCLLQVASHQLCNLYPMNTAFTWTTCQAVCQTLYLCMLCLSGNCARRS